MTGAAQALSMMIDLRTVPSGISIVMSVAVLYLRGTEIFFFRIAFADSALFSGQ